MYKMSSKERIMRMYEHREADRVPVIDRCWGSTLERWKREGMPEEQDFISCFDLDRTATIDVDNGPQYEEKVLEETEKYLLYTTSWGATLKNWKHAASTPEFLDFRIKDIETWVEAKKRMVPTYDRIPWDMLKNNYSKWRDEGYWIEAYTPFGFDAAHSWTVGTERLLIALMDEPEWCMDIFNHFLDMNIALFDMIWDKGYEFDSITWCDDMGYKNNQFFSVKTYRELLKPYHKKVIDWAHAKGAKTHLHSCGDINPFIPELIEIGLDALNPLEVKAGMNPVEIKQKFGERLVLHGGINAVLWNDPSAIEDEIRRVLPVVKASGGYIFSSDHSIPDSVSFEDIKRIIDIIKEVGSYS